MWIAFGSRPAAAKIGSPYSRSVFSISASRMPEPALAGATAATVATTTALIIVKADDKILARKGVLERLTTDDLPINLSVQGAIACPAASAYLRPAPTKHDRRAPGRAPSIG